jgi:excisionase family DNA binding protein
MKHPSEDKLLKASEVARWLGVSRSTVHRWAEAGNLPKPYEIGESAVRWRKSEIETWLEERKR